MGSNHSTSRASAAAEAKYSDTIAPDANQTLDEFATDKPNSTSKDLHALAHVAAAENDKTGPRHQKQGPAPSPLDTFTTRLEEALAPLTEGKPIDLARVATHACPNLGATAPSFDHQKPMPGPAGPGIHPEPLAVDSATPADLAAAAAPVPSLPDPPARCRTLPAAQNAPSRRLGCSRCGLFFDAWPYLGPTPLCSACRHPPSEPSGI